MSQRPHHRWSRSSIIVAVLAALLLATLGCRTAAPPTRTDDEVLYAWVQLGPEGQISARAITEAASCPSITVGKTTVPMTARAAAPASFGVTSCEHPVAAGARSASIGGRELRLPEKTPKRIVVVGDTGCRIKKTDVQNCNGKGSGTPWSFSKIAAAAAAVEPDLILHVGDYLYRESPCPAGNAGCEGTPYGDTWATWKVDFFEPVGELLGAAPWVFVRGNHEECKRSWRGWFYFLDPRPVGDDPWQQANCQAYTPPYPVPVGGGLDLLVMDTSTIVHDYGETPDPQMVSQYTQEFTVVDQQATGAGRAWFTTHRPIWALSAYLDDGTPKISPTDLTLQAAVGNSQDHALPDNVEWVVAGHVHNFEHLTFTDGRPPSTVAGGGGTKLDPAITPQLLDANPQALEELNLKRDDFVTREEFGFLVAEPDGKGWQVRVLSETGEVEYSFRVGG